MIMRLFIGLIILIAVAVGTFALLISHNQISNDQLIKLVIFRDFFDVSMPILGFGALIKYLCTCCVRCNNCHKNHCK